MNHDKVAAFVGDCDSIDEFIRKTASLKNQTAPSFKRGSVILRRLRTLSTLEQRLSLLKQRKADWVEATQRIARGELK